MSYGVHWTGLALGRSMQNMAINHQTKPNRRRSTRTGYDIHHVEHHTHRSHSIPSVPIRMSPRIQLSSYHSIDISVSIRDLIYDKRSIAHRIGCELWENETDNEESWRRVGRGFASQSSHTRHIDFEDKFAYQYVFEKTQLIKVNIIRCHDGERASSSSDDIIGCCIFKVDELIGSFGLQLRKTLHATVTIASVYSGSRPSTSSLGGVLITAQMPEKEQPIVVQLHGKSLDRKDFLWDETAVFFRVFRFEEGEGNDDDSLILLYESEAIKNHSHPQWGEFQLATREAADNRNRLLEVWVMYKDVDGTEGYIGKFLTTYAKMKYGPGPDNVYTVINEHKKAQKKSYENSGKMELVKFTDVSFCSFLDYIVSGTQLHFEIAIDFSQEDGSNQLRFDNDFHLAVRAIGGILRDYTPNRLFPAFGFGAKIPPTFHESHEFHLNFSMDPCCRGLDGVIEAYRGALAAVNPTKEAKLAPVINYAVKLSQQSGFRGLHYHIITIFTRGAISDYKEAQSALVSATEAPLSILLIGVGNGDFSLLNKLAAPRKDGKRDCVEFINLEELLDAGDSPVVNRNRIAEQCLHPVPQHLVTYMHRANIAAKPPIQVCRSPLFHSSNLIPDRPTQFDFNMPTPPDMTPSPDRRSDRRSDRRGSDSQYLEAENEMRNTLTVRMPERAHSVLQTTKEQYQRRLKERGLGKMRFPRIELSTLESSGSTQDSIR